MAVDSLSIQVRCSRVRLLGIIPDTYNTIRISVSGVFGTLSVLFVTTSAL